MNVTIPIECEEGHQYLLKLTDCRNLPIDTTVEVVDITLASVGGFDVINNAGTLHKIASTLLYFLEENDVVLYFYCSKDPIKIRRNRVEVPYQEYRSMLFTSLFERIAYKHKARFINRQIVLKDNVYGDHYIHLMAKEQHTPMVARLEEQLNSFIK